MASLNHELPLRSGGVLNLDALPSSFLNLSSAATTEMLEACRDRIFFLEAKVQAEPRTPVRPSKPAMYRTPQSGAKTAPAQKSLSAAQLSKEKKSIVKDIKKRVTPLKFYGGWDQTEQTERELKFTADRLPADAAAHILGVPRDSWSTATISATLGENDAAQALGLDDGELKGSVWRKGGVMRMGRFGASKSVRLGTAPLVIKTLKLNYTVKSQRLTGSIVCVNGKGLREALPTSGRKRSRRAAFGSHDFLLDGGSDLDSGEDFGPSSTHWMH